MTIEPRAAGSVATSEGSMAPRKTSSLVFTLWLCAALLGACSAGGEGRGAARVVVHALGVGADAVQKVVLEVVPQSPTGGAPVTLELALADGRAQADVAELPVGTYTFRAAAVALDGETVLFSGETTGTVAPRETLAVALVLQQVTPPQPFSNVAPRITGLVSSIAMPRPGQPVTLAVTASDPDDAAALAYAWELSCPGRPTATSTFSPQGGATTTLVSPCVGPATVACRVTDPRGTTSSASLSLTYDSSPVITSIDPAAPQVVAGADVTITVTAVDPEGDALGYAWTSDCGAALTGGDTATAVFHAPPDVRGTCLLTVEVADPYGATATQAVPVSLLAPSYTVSVTPIAATTYQYPCGQYVCGSHCCDWNWWGTCSSYCADYCTQYCPVPVPFSVSSAPAGISCGGGSGGASGTCSYSFATGTSVTLTSSSSGTVFSGDCTGVGSCTMIVTHPASVTARN